MAQPFNINQPPNTSESVTLNYLPMGLNNVGADSTNSWVTAACSRASSPNVTYTNSSNITKNYYATSMWIVGGASGTTYPLHTFSGFPTTVLPNGSPTAELIIQHISDDGDSTLYACFLLNFVGANAPPGGQIDAIFNAVGSNQSTVTVDFSADIFRNLDTNAVYVQYISSTLSPGANVIIYSNPINIGSAQVGALQNNLGLFDMSSSNYTIIPPAVPGQWMECDYVPIDSEEVASYSLPLVSGVVEQGGAQNSMKTIMMFIVFSLLTAFAYLIIPRSYLYLVHLITSQYSANYIYYLNIAISTIFIGLSIIFILHGAFSDTTSSNYYLTTGFTLGILYMLGYVIIQSKIQTDPNFLPVN